MTRSTAFAAAGLVAAALALPSAALGASGTTGGATPPADAPAGSAPGTAPPLGPIPFGVPVRPAMQLRGLRCLTGCADVRTPRTGSRLRVRGRNLARTDVVVFLGAEGAGDDVAVRPLARKRTAIDVLVPLGAVAGPITVADRDGTRALPAAAPLALAPGVAAAPQSVLAAGPGVDVQVADPRGFVDAAVPPRMTYVVHGAQPAAVTIEIVRATDGALVTSWPGGTVPPEVPQTASWDGMVAGKPQRTGRYAFRVRAQGAAAPGLAPAPATAAISQARAADPAAFMLLGNVFPVRGPHGYGEAAARFGGARHHQGQDVFAACGTPLVAARGGVVKHRDFQSAAGNYLVIDGEQTGTDYGYMHLRGPALVAKGERVRTGQPIGYVGDTGHADGCHLHLELWTAPGWYGGGSPLDPLPYLLAWDRRS